MSRPVDRLPQGVWEGGLKERVLPDVAVNVEGVVRVERVVNIRGRLVLGGGLGMYKAGPHYME